MLRYSEASGLCVRSARSFGVPQDDNLSDERDREVGNLSDERDWKVGNLGDERDREVGNLGDERHWKVHNLGERGGSLRQARGRRFGGSQDDILTSAGAFYS